MNVRARYTERVLMREHTDDVKTAEALTRAHPDDWRSWVVLSAAHATLHHGAELEAALARAIALGFKSELDLKSAATAPYWAPP